MEENKKVLPVEEPSEEVFKGAALDYISDDETVVTTNEVKCGGAKMEQIICVNRSDLDISIYQAPTYKEIFVKDFMDCFIENLDLESHVLVSYPQLAEFVLPHVPEGMKNEIKYLKTLIKTYKEAKENNLQIRMPYYEDVIEED